jgi:uncharacterized protein (DUF2461 family)
LNGDQKRFYTTEDLIVEAQKGHIEELFELLRFRSVSAQSEYAGDIQAHLFRIETDQRQMVT